MTSSLYQYLTVANLELYATVDYSATAGAYSDLQIEANITHAERLVNVYMGKTYTGTIPDAIVSATEELAYMLMYNHMVDDGAITGQTERLMGVQNFDQNHQKKGSKYVIGIIGGVKDILDAYQNNTWTVDSASKSEVI